LCIRSENTGEVRELSLRLTRFRGLRWSPDGRSILTVGADLKDRRGAYLIDVKTGEVISDFIRPNLPFPPDWAPSGEAIIFAHRDFKKIQSQILWRDLTTGKEKKLGPIHQDAILNRVILSPDGSQLAACNWRSKEKAIDLVVRSVDGGPLKTLLTIAAPEGIRDLAWARDGKQLLFFKKLGDDTSELWALSTEGGEPRDLGIQAGYIFQLSVHPDGKQIAFAGDSRDDKPQVWIMEDFLSKSVASK
jgi:Tol biopolymer transport system component